MGELRILSLLVCYLLDRSIDHSIITKCNFLPKRISISTRGRVRIGLKADSHPHARRNTDSFWQRLLFVELIDLVLKIERHLY